MAKFEENRIFILNEPNAPRTNPALAREIGFNEHIILLQLEFLIAIHGKKQNHESGQKWIYMSIRDWVDIFDWWGKDTISRALLKLERDDLILVEKSGQWNDYKYDKTFWYALNLSGLSRLKSISIKGYATHQPQNETGLPHNETASPQNETGVEPEPSQNETTIPEIETLIENPIERGKPPVAQDGVRDESEEKKNGEGNAAGTLHPANDVLRYILGEDRWGEMMDLGFFRPVEFNQLQRTVMQMKGIYPVGELRKAFENLQKDPERVERGETHICWLFDTAFNGKAALVRVDKYVKWKGKNAKNKRVAAQCSDGEAWPVDDIL